MLFRWGIIISLGLISFAGIGQGKVSLNDNWQFQAGEDTLSSAWSRVNIPHTWNAVDVYEDNGYYRGIGWYKTSLSFNQYWTNKQVYLKFEGVNQVAEIFLNGHPVGSHIGGYNAFVIDLTGHIDSLKSNILVVKVDNSHNDHIIPLKGDFNFYGGIYRDVYLITENYIHFDYNLGADGVFVKSDVSDASARLTIELDLVNRTAESAKLMAKIAVLDHESEVSSVK